MDGLIIFFGVMQLLVGIALALLHSEIKKLRNDFENHGHSSSWE